MATGECIACTTMDVELNDEDMCEKCAAEMAGDGDGKSETEEEM